MIICTNSSYITIDVWEDIDYGLLLEIIDKLKIKNLFVDASKEWEPNFTGKHVFHDFDNNLQFAKELKLRKVKTTFLLGTFNKFDYDKRYLDIINNLERNGVEFEFFPYLWLNETYKDIKTQTKWRNKIQNSTPKRLGYIFVNRPHDHRCSFIDQLHANKLDNDIQFTWNLLSDTYYDRYNFKFWNEKIVIDPEDSYTKGDFSTNWDLPSNAYFDSLFEIVLETHIDTIFISEKTWKPIVFGKPFLVYGRQGFHRRLEDIGFKLFHHTIDYDFDDMIDPDKRILMMMEQLQKLRLLNYEDILKKIEPVVKYNQNLARKLMRSLPARYNAVTRYDEMDPNAWGNIDLYI